MSEDLVKQDELRKQEIINSTTEIVGDDSIYIDEKIA